MYTENELRELYELLKKRDVRHETVFSEGQLSVSGLHGKVEVNREGTKFYVNGELYDQAAAEEAEAPKGLYEVIEQFFGEFQKVGMAGGNAVYAAVKEKAEQKKNILVYFSGAVVLIFLVLFFFTYSPLWLLWILVIPAAVYAALSEACKKVFRENWICPECRKQLPTRKKRIFPCMEYVPQCPHCGCVLERTPEIAPAGAENAERIDELPAPTRKWPRRMTGGAAVFISLLLLPLVFVSDVPLDPVGVGTAIVMLLGLLADGLLLLRYRNDEPENLMLPAAAVQRQKVFLVIGVIVWVLGFLGLLEAIIIAGTPPFDEWNTFLSALFGIPMIILGTRMLLYAMGQGCRNVRVKKKKM